MTDGWVDMPDYTDDDAVYEVSAAGTGEVVGWEFNNNRRVPELRDLAAIREDLDLQVCSTHENDERIARLFADVEPLLNALEEVRGQRHAALDTGPKTPAVGEGGHWKHLGECGIDSGHMAVVDPAMANVDECYKVEFLAGLGDGRYDVWGWVVDYDGEAGERIAQVVVTLIDEPAIAEWREDD